MVPGPAADRGSLPQTVTRREAVVCAV